jgi:hypothetical protein
MTTVTLSVVEGYSSYCFINQVNFKSMSYSFYGRSRDISPLVMIQLLFGRFGVIFGTFFTLFGLIFLVVFMSFAKFDNISDNDPFVQGVISETFNTTTYVNDRNVIEYVYNYKSPDGIEHTGKSFSEKYFFRPGDTVNIQYNSSLPSISRIKGTRTSEIGGGWVFISVPFLLIGLGFLFFSVRKVFRDIFLLRYGKVAMGKMLTKEPTSMSINNQPVYRFYFQFVADDGKTYTATCNTHLPYWIEDEEEEKLIYDPRDPENALLVDSLPRPLRKEFRNIT